MKPAIPPFTVAALCGLPVAEQARRAGVSKRHMVRLIRSDWSRWKVETAERWCIACGVDFWNLDHKGLLRKARWDTSNPRHLEALHRTIEAAGARPTREAVEKLAKALNAHVDA